MFKDLTPHVEAVKARGGSMAISIRSALAAAAVVLAFAVTVGASYEGTLSLGAPQAQAASRCRPGWEQDAALCYPKCRPGYRGRGPVCWRQGKNSYTRAGFAWKAGDKLFSLNGARARCQARHGRRRCEKWGALIYPKCRAGYRNVGCCICRTTQEVSYTRGAGKPLETVKAALKKAVNKVKTTLNKAGQWLKNFKDKVIGKIKAFGDMVVSRAKTFLGKVIGKIVDTFVDTLGFTSANVASVIDPKTGKIKEAEVRRVAVERMLVQYVLPALSEKVAELIQSAIEKVKPMIDSAVSGLIGGLGSIPVVGGAIAGAVHAAYSVGSSILTKLAKNKLAKWIVSFLFPKVQSFLLGLALTRGAAPLIGKGIEFLREKSSFLKKALDRLFKRAMDFFKNWVRHPSQSCGQPLASTSWRRVPGDLRQVDVGDDGTAWGVTAAGAIRTWSGKGWVPVPGQLIQISVGSAKHVWGVTSKDLIFRWNGSAWDRVPGNLRHVEVGADGEVWGINRADQIFRWTGNSWQQVGGNLRQVAVGSSGNVWGVNKDGLIFRRGQSGWQQIGGSLSNISASAGGLVWGVNKAGQVHFYTPKGWVPVYGKQLRQISVGNGVWGVDTKGQIWRR